MKVAVLTGCTGQVCSYLAEHLLALDYRVIGLARRVSTENKWRLKKALAHKNFELVGADVTDVASIFSVVAKYQPDEFYNFAGQSYVAASFDECLSTFDITGKGALNCLEAIRQLRPQCKFLQASSSEMFGRNFSVHKYVGERDEFFDLKYQNEHTPLSPQSPYSVAKVAAHYMTELYRRAYNLHATSAIFFNMESGRRGEEFVTRKITKYVGDFHKSDFSTSFPKLKLGNLCSYRDWTYAEESMRGAYLAVQQKESDTYVFGTGEAHTVRDFVDDAFSIVGKNYLDHVELDPKMLRPAEVDFLLCDSTKARNLLGWVPKTNFKELVKLMVGADINGEQAGY